MRDLPARANRGKRIHKLLGEEAEADEEFWGQEAWNEDGDDEDYSTEEEEEDVVDADFDDEERPDEDVHNEEEELVGSRRRRAGTRIKRSVYQEPKSIRKSPTPVAKRAKKEHRVGDSSKGPHVDEVEASVEATSSSVAAASAAAAAFDYEVPTMRKSTTRKVSESSLLRKRNAEDAARAAAKLRKPQTKGVRFSQAELIREAVRTEVENTQSLNRLEQLEEEKRSETITPKAPPYNGLIVRYHSCVGMPKTITFLNTEEFPPIFNQPKPKKPQKHRQSHNIVEEKEKSTA